MSLAGRVSAFAGIAPIAEHQHSILDYLAGASRHELTTLAKETDKVIRLCQDSAIAPEIARRIGPHIILPDTLHTYVIVGLTNHSSRYVTTQFCGNVFGAAVVCSSWSATVT